MIKGQVMSAKVFKIILSHLSYKRGLLKNLLKGQNVHQ